MDRTKGCSDRLLRKVEDRASRVHLLKTRLAEQTVSVKLEHYWELAHVRSRFAEFKWRVQQLAEDEDSQLQRDHEALDDTWTDLVNALDALLAALPEAASCRRPARVSF